MSDRPGGALARQPGGGGGAPLRSSGADGCHHPILRPKLDATRDQVESALVGVAFFEQDAAGAQVANVCFSRERQQILRLQSVERGEILENREFYRSFIHRECLKLRRATL